MTFYMYIQARNGLILSETDVFDDVSAYILQFSISITHFQ